MSQAKNLLRNVIAIVLLFLLVGCTTSKVQSIENEPEKIDYSYIRDMYIDVLQSNVGFYHIRNVFGHDEPFWEYVKLVEHLGLCEIDNVTVWEISQFTFYDVYNSNVPAVVLEFTPGGDRLVLYYNIGSVYGIFVAFRGMRGITTDGMFHGSSGAAFTNISKMQFSSRMFEIIILGESDFNQETMTPIYYISGEEISPEIWYSFRNEFFEKEEVLWYEFSNETIVDDFALAWSKYVR